jgi:hypothetical protein
MLAVGTIALETKARGKRTRKLIDIAASMFLAASPTQPKIQQIE